MCITKKAWCNYYNLPCWMSKTWIPISSLQTQDTAGDQVKNRIKTDPLSNTKNVKTPCFYSNTQKRLLTIYKICIFTVINIGGQQPGWHATSSKCQAKAQNSDSHKSLATTSKQKCIYENYAMLGIRIAKAALIFLVAFVSWRVEAGCIRYVC